MSSEPYRRTVEETFIGAGGALERGFQLDGKVREFYIQSAAGQGIFKKLELMSLWYSDVTQARQQIGSDVVYTCDAILILRASDLPRRPLTGELIHHPRNIAWAIAESIEIRGFYQIGLNRASAA
jgi:hypothetical protein